MKKQVFFFALLALLLGSASAFSQDDDDLVRKFDPQKDSVFIPFEFRGAWLSTVESIDWPKTRIMLKEGKKEAAAQREQQK